MADPAPTDAPQPSARRRGRPRGGSDARERILSAATEEFGRHGFDAVTMRAIATRAKVDAALVHHYFGTKPQLFAAAVWVPLQFLDFLPSLLAGPRAGFGTGVVRYVLERLHDPDVRTRFVVLLRTTIGTPAATQQLVVFLQNQLIAPVAAELGRPDAELRAALAGSQLVGLLIARHVVPLPAVVAASDEELIARVGGSIQRCLDEPGIDAL